MFRNLQELDIANNCIIDISQFMYLTSLNNITRLALQGNPVCFHPNYRINVVKYLSPGVTTQKVYLDGKILTKTELKYLPKGDAYRLRNTAAMFEASITSVDSYFTNTSLPPSSYTSGVTDDDDTDSVSDRWSRARNSKHKKKRKHRQPSIDDALTDRSQQSSRATTPFVVDASDMQHEVETIRKQLGHDWLVGLSSKPKRQQDDVFIENDRDVTKNGAAQSENQKPTVDGALSVHKQEPLENEQVTRSRTQSTLSEDGPFIVTILGSTTSGNQEIFLSISNQCLHERNLDGKTIEKLDIKSIESVKTRREVIFDEVSSHHSMLPIVTIMLDYVMKTRQKREYVMEDEENCKLLLEILQPLVDKYQYNSQCLIHQYQCLKCSSVFDKHHAHKKVQSRSKTPSQMYQQSAVKMEENLGFDSLHEVPVCPHCGNELLIEIEKPTMIEHSLSTPVGSIASVGSAQPLAASSPWKTDNDNSFLSAEGNSSSDYVTADTESYSSPVRDINNDVSVSTLIARSLPFDSEMTLHALSTRGDSFSPSKTNRNLELEFVENEIRKSDVFSEKVPNDASDDAPHVGEVFDFPSGKVQELLQNENKESFNQKYSLVPTDVFSSSDSDSSNNSKRGKNGANASEISPQRLRRTLGIVAENKAAMTLQYPTGFPKDPIESSVTTPTENAAFGRVSQNGQLHHPRHRNSINDITILPTPKETNVEKVVQDDVLVNSSSSDIAVLSNPSQSSILLLPSPSTECSVYDMHVSTVSAGSSSGVSSNSGVPRSVSLNESLLNKSEHTDRLHSPESGIYDSSIASPSVGDTTFSAITAETCASMVKSVYERTLDSTDEEEKSTRGDSDDFTHITPLTSLSNTPTPMSLLEMSSSFTDSSTVYTGSVGSHHDRSLTDSGRHGKHRTMIMLPIQYNYDDFTVVDHRLKLYAMMSLFKHEEEEFQCVLKSPLVQHPKGEYYSSLLIVSSHNIYILKIHKEETDTPTEWLQKKAQYSIGYLQYINIGLSNQNFQLEFNSDNSCYTYLVRDATRCKTFIECFTGIIKGMPENKLKDITSENPTTYANLITQVLITGSHDDSIVETDTDLILYLLAYHKVKNSKGHKKQKPITIVVTATDICLVEEDHQWPLPKLQAPPSTKSQQFTCKIHQKISNISGIELYEDAVCQIRIEFFNEDTGDESSWDVVTETEQSMNSLVTAIKDPWEKIFAIELQKTVHPTIDIQDM
ncbi:uncharacterized protein LOC100372138 [Saccoglossus kowalevskii]|uniref:Serine/threonine-protein kinase 11-interacting protein-like n=1 Tax=Saccoglossus kowalevskii TaxID=10224 RepID=A0ABM0MV58_SACKO|nr:PREDICTED: serine/threonine-protein kinase 11-interacting protein-like [Saccoglossus kowalevskii]